MSTALPQTLLDYYQLGIFVLFCLGIYYIVIKQLTVPPQLAHLPVVPIGPVLWSYFTKEPENQRIERLIVPFANQNAEGVVLVYVLGRWMVHVLDAKIVKYILDDPEKFPKEDPPDGILLWRLVGYSNIILANGKQWKHHSQVVRSALSGRVPIETFVTLSKRLFQRMGKGGLVTVDDLFMRFTLDAVGTTALGHDFNAIEDDESPFVQEYSQVMEAIANPLYLIFTSLEKLFPRRQVMKRIDDLRARMDEIMEAKREKPGSDMFSFMLEHPDMSNDECRDNMVVFFIAGHDTAAGALSSFIYYLAKNPDIQSRLRTEVTAALGSIDSEHRQEPTQDNLQSMAYLTACIREALRLNTPITYIVPRICTCDIVVKGGRKERSYAIPRGSSLIMNLTAVHHTEAYYEKADEFIPERFLAGTAHASDINDTLTWLPFATGPRRCPARNFAMYEMRVLAALLLTEWTWSLPTESPHARTIINGFSPFALSLPKDLKVEFTPLRCNGAGLHLPVSNE